MASALWHPLTVQRCWAGREAEQPQEGGCQHPSALPPRPGDKPHTSAATRAPRRGAPWLSTRRRPELPQAEQAAPTGGLGTHGGLSTPCTSGGLWGEPPHRGQARLYPRLLQTHPRNKSPRKSPGRRERREGTKPELDRARRTRAAAQGWQSLGKVPCMRTAAPAHPGPAGWPCVTQPRVGRHRRRAEECRGP